MPESKSIELTPSLAIIVAGVIIAAAIIFVHLTPSSAQPAQADNAQASANVPAPSAGEHIVGSPSAPVVLVEYSDFQCPYCQMIYPSLKNIVSGSNGQVAWVMREYPLYQIHPQAMPAADAAECINAQLGNAGYWKFADTIFADQTKLSPTYYAQLAAQFGADPAKFSACVAAQTYQQKIQNQIAEAQINGGNGTPYTIILNTKTGKQYPFSGALPEAQIRALINAVQ